MRKPRADGLLRLKGDTARSRGVRRKGHSVVRPSTTIAAPMHPDLALLTTLQLSLLAVMEDIADGLPYALLDFPLYDNVGDSLLWLGARRVLRQANRSEPRYVCAKNTFKADELQALLPHGTIYLLGGGNFGDLWIEHQQFRELLMEKFPHLRIVQLPQSIKFVDAAKEARARSVITSHGNMVLMARDTASHRIALRLGAKAVYLAPDLAFAVPPIQRPRGPDVEILALLRDDKERTAASARLLEGASLIVDWAPLSQTALSVKALHVALRVARRLPTVGRIPRRILLDRLATLRVSRGAALLSRGAFVRTDRLHGHVMCLLLGIPHEIADNSYGKIGALIRTWTSGARLLRSFDARPTLTAASDGGGTASARPQELTDTSVLPLLSRESSAA